LHGLHEPEGAAGGGRKPEGPDSSRDPRHQARGEAQGRRRRVHPGLSRPRASAIQECTAIPDRSPEEVMSEVTQLLSAIEQGDPRAAGELLPLVYDELRTLAAARMTGEKPGQTLQATALVHEAYLRLVDVGRAQHWNSRGHFFAAAAEAMRRILADHARR